MAGYPQSDEPITAGPKIKRVKPTTKSTITTQNTN